MRSEEGVNCEGDTPVRALSRSLRCTKEGLGGEEKVGEKPQNVATGSALPQNG